MECGLSGFLAYTPLITRQADFCTSQTTSDSQVIIQFVFLLPCCPSLPSTFEPQEGSTQTVQRGTQAHRVRGMVGKGADVCRGFPLGVVLSLGVGPLPNSDSTGHRLQACVVLLLDCGEGARAGRLEAQAKEVRPELNHLVA